LLSIFVTEKEGEEEEEEEEEEEDFFCLIWSSAYKRISLWISFI
jgi:hypothetical protein